MIVARAVPWIKLRCGIRLYFWTLALAALSLGFCFVPLLNLLGYDFSAALGLVAAFAAADVGHGVATSAKARGATHGTFTLALHASLASMAMLVLPLLFSLGNALRVRNCNLGAGLHFFALLPLGSVLFAASASVIPAVLLPQRRRGRVLGLLMPLISILWTLVRLYRDPAVFALDPYGGFFPGPIYDEALSPPRFLLAYRMVNLVWLLTCLALAAKLTQGIASSPGRPRLQHLYTQPKPWLWMAPLVGLSLFLFEERGSLGFHITHDDLSRTLPREIRTPHFVMRVDAAGESEDEIKWLTQDLEFRYHQLKTTLGIEPKLPIRVYRFPSAEMKKATLGAGGTLYAKPWTQEIFIQADRFPSRHLRHELAHVFASAFGDPVFGISFRWLPWPRLSGGLVEGLAEAVDANDPVRAFTLHEEAAAMHTLGSLPSIERLLGAGFTLESGPRGYTAVGSFCTFLMERYGALALRKLYQTAGDFQAVLGRDLSALTAEYQGFLSGLPKNPRALAVAEERFRRPAIFGKVCARELSARVEQARDLFASHPARAVELLQSTCADDPHEPVFQLELAEAYVANGEVSSALATLERVEGTLTRPLYQRSLALKASLYFQSRQIDQARQVVEAGLAAAMDDANERAWQVKRRALAEDEAGEALSRIFLSDPRPVDPALTMYLFAEFARLSPQDPLGPYLLGRQLASRDPALAKEQLRAACPLVPHASRSPLPELFLRECRRLLGETAFLSRDVSLAQESFASLLSLTPHQAERLRAQTFLDRIAWEKGR